MRLDLEEIHLIRGMRLRGISQRQIAKRLGVSNAAVCQWYSGKRRCSRQHLRALRALLEETKTPAERASDERVKALSALQADRLWRRQLCLIDAFSDQSIAAPACRGPTNPHSPASLHVTSCHNE